MKNTVMMGNNKELLKQLETNSIDSVVCDPPYELGFMGKKWDSTGIAYDVELWKEVLRVLKPGGYLLAFSGTRTYHRMAVAIEDAGFEVKDMIEWCYGSGFPKSMDISKQIDKMAGAEREVIGQAKGNINQMSDGRLSRSQVAWESEKKEYNITAPSTEEAKQWQGFGTALKPAHEPICVARKPIKEKNIALNVLKYGTGGINIDGCRIGNFKNTQASGIHRGKISNFSSKNTDDYKPLIIEQSGRFPANLIIDEFIAGELDKQSGVSKSRPSKGTEGNTIKEHFWGEGWGLKERKGNNHNDEGGASRYFLNIENEEQDFFPFFYCAKASRKERDSDYEGNQLQGEKKKLDIGDDSPSGGSWERRTGQKPSESVNNHPTIKPIKLIQYLVRLVTPKEGTSLDLFSGSGTHAIACIRENINYIEMEMQEEYVEIIKERIRRN